MVSPLNVIVDAFSVLIVEHRSFHKCGRNCVVGKFPLVLGVVESSRVAPVLAEDVQLLGDTVLPLQAGGKKGCGEMEDENVSDERM